MAVHNRLIKTENVKISDLKIDDGFVSDDYLVSLIVKSHKGIIKTGLTRVDVDQIHSGFFIRENKSIKSISNLNREYIPSYIKMIRGGHRPTLTLYWSPVSPSGGQYVCPDEETALAAYRALGFKFVPCSVLRPIKKKSHEAMIIVSESDKKALYESSVSGAKDKLLLRLSPDNTDLNLTVKILKSECERLCRDIVNFHDKHSDELHYNQMMHSFLVRHCKGIDSVKIMVELNRIEDAEIIIRMLYEALLNLYIDWISPAFIGPALHLFSLIRSDSLASSGQKCDDEYRDAFSIISSFEGLFEKTIEKAKISSLGISFYERLYSMWSLTAHQSYANLASESTDFSDSSPPVTEVKLNSICKCLDVITCEILRIVSNDIGKYDDFMSGRLGA